MEPVQPEVKSTYHIWRNHIEDQPIEDFVPAGCNNLMYVCMYASELGLQYEIANSDHGIL